MRKLKTAPNCHLTFGKNILSEHTPTDGTVLDMILFANHRETGALILKKPFGGWKKVAVWAQAFSKHSRIRNWIVGREREWRQWGRRLSRARVWLTRPFLPIANLFVCRTRFILFFCWWWNSNCFDYFLGSIIYFVRLSTDRILS